MAADNYFYANSIGNFSNTIVHFNSNSQNLFYVIGEPARSISFALPTATGTF